MLKTHPLLKIVNGALKELPSPSTLNSLWNFGSLLGLCLIIQLLSGIFLALHFSANVEISFWAVSHMSRDVSMGWFLRMVHANGASLFFISLYTHMARGVWYGSYRFSATWSVGVGLLLLVMAAAFLGYVLPWGQMSFWGATVITNLFSALPYIGEDLVVWLWGGFAVDNATLTRFFTFHFLVPFVVLALGGVHLLFLHESGSSNPLGLQMNSDKAPFHPYFSTKDLVGVIAALTWLLTMVGVAPWALGDPENFIEANPLVTPVHIQPEWYFLFAYAILRAIPNKLGGVLALAAAVVVFMVLPHTPISKFQSSEFYLLNKILFWVFLNAAILLTWIGACPVEAPYVGVGQGLTLVYFSFFGALPLGKYVTDTTLSYH